MSTRHQPYFRVPRRITPDLLAEIKRAGRSVYLTALLHHIEWQEDELDKPPAARQAWRELIGGKV